MSAVFCCCFPKRPEPLLEEYQTLPPTSADYGAITTYQAYQEDPPKHLLVIDTESESGRSHHTQTANSIKKLPQLRLGGNVVTRVQSPATTPLSETYSLQVTPSKSNGDSRTINKVQRHGNLVIVGSYRSDHSPVSNLCYSAEEFILSEKVAPRRLIRDEEKKEDPEESSELASRTTEDHQMLFEMDEDYKQ